MKTATMFSTAVIIAAAIAGLIHFFAKQPTSWQWALVWLGLLVISQIQVLVLRRKANKREKILEELRDIHEIIEEPKARKPGAPLGDYPLLTFESETITALLKLSNESKTEEGKLVYLKTARKMTGNAASLDQEIKRLKEGKG